MTETEWMDCTDPLSMLGFLETIPGLSEWKVRLFICACWRARLRVVVEPKALLRDIEAVESGRYRHLPMRFFPTYTNPWEAAKQSSKVGIRAAAKKTAAGARVDGNAASGPAPLYLRQPFPAHPL